MSKKVIWTVIVLIILGLIIWMRPTKGPNFVNTNEPIKIGANLALTSFGASWGENALKGAELAIKEINQDGGVLGRELKLIVEDNKSEGKGSVSAATKLISVDKIQFLIAGWSDQVEPIIPIIDQNKIITITVSAGASGITKKSQYLFRTWPADEIAVKTLVDYAKSKGFKRIAMAQSIGSWEKTLTDSFKSLAQQEGIMVFDVVSFQADTQDFKTIITKLKSQQPDALFTPITSGPVERFMRQAGELGLNTPILYPVDVLGIGIPDKVPLPYLKSLIYAIYAPSQQKFIDAHKKEYGIEPGVSADTAYDAVYMLAHAIEKAGSTDSDKVAASFTSLDGASGKIVFNQDRDRSAAEVLLMGFDGVSKVPVRIK